MKGLFLSIGVATAMALGGQASAGVGPPVGGEASSVFSCFYECKPGSRLGTWAEVTTLMLVNQRAPIGAPPLIGGFFADLAILDGNQNIIAVAGTFLSAEDLDEVHVCRSLQAAQDAGLPVPVPEAGLIEVVLSENLEAAFDDPYAFGGYGWVKNLVGKFFTTVDEPFRGRVTGIAKTECRLVPIIVTTPDEIFEKVREQEPPPINLVVIEGTFEPDAPPGDGTVGAAGTAGPYAR
jgi:hypothetical protein